MRARIIKATNSQTQIPIASLRATELIHRDIEEYLRPHGLSYDRRKNHYKNEGKPIEKIVGIPHLAQSVMSLALLRPNDARARPSSLLKRSEDYDKVFNRDYPIGLYLSCAAIMKRVDHFISSESAQLDRKDQTNFRLYVAMEVACTAVGKAAPTSEETLPLFPGILLAMTRWWQLRTGFWFSIKRWAQQIKLRKEQTLRANMSETLLDR